MRAELPNFPLSFLPSSGKTYFNAQAFLLHKTGFKEFQIKVHDPYPEHNGEQT